jgi:hypothetical protein
MDILVGALRGAGEQLIPLSVVPSVELHRIYQVRWDRIQNTGDPESRGFAEFVNGLAGDVQSVSLFEFRASEWLLVGYISEGMREVGGVLALRSGSL